MSSEALEGAERIRVALGGEHAWRGGVEDARRVVAEAHDALAALLAEVARLEQERDEAREELAEYRDELHVETQRRSVAEAALAVARERDQRRTKAFERIARMFERVDGMTVSCGSLESAADIARAALVDEPAAAEPSIRDAIHPGVAWVSTPDPAVATLAEEGGRASNRAADAPSLAGWSSVGGASTEPSDCAPSSASAAADEPGETRP